MDKTDEGLLGNEKIEEAIAALQQTAHTGIAGACLDSSAKTHA